MFQDEARFGRISETRKCWCPRPTRPLCQAMVSQQYVYAYAAASVADGELDSLILPYVNGTCMQLFIDEVAARHPGDRIVMVMDGAGWHQGLTPPSNLRLVKLPPYSPELNPVEHLWAEVPLVDWLVGSNPCGCSCRHPARGGCPGRCQRRSECA